MVSLDFSVIYSFRTYHGPRVDSAPSENEYQEYFPGVKLAGAWGWQPHHLCVPNVMKSGSLNLLVPSGSHRACYGSALLYLTANVPVKVLNRVGLMMSQRKANALIVWRRKPLHSRTRRDCFFFFNRLCNPCGFWPAQLSLSILSRKVFTECRCQQHVKPPNLEDQWLERSNSRHKVFPASKTTQVNPSIGRWSYGREICREFCRKWRLPRQFWVLLHAVNLRHGTDGFTSPPKEGVLKIFYKFYS